VQVLPGLRRDPLFHGRLAWVFREVRTSVRQVESVGTSPKLTLLRLVTNPGNFHVTAF